MDEYMVWGFIRLLIALLFIIPATIFVTRWYAKRHAPGKELLIREALSLGTNKSLYLIEWEDQLLLLGVTNHEITLLEKRESESKAQDRGDEENGVFANNNTFSQH